ncbi:glycosyltransferase family 39 protein [Nocardia rhamnosiphila]|uniref:glycosyltransferase family 39 protein n=1 Tax=Nocardia rhamnosiphila TaxID=426716 RepID=UPI0033CE86AD
MYWVAGVFAVLLAGCADRYGYHRDEMYFLAAGRRLDWGYADQPPLVPLLARAMAAIDAHSLVVLRLPAIVAATAVIVCTGWAARELGGSRAAQTLAAAAAASSALLLGGGHQLGTVIFDLAVWSAVVVTVLRLLRPESDRRWWLLAGVLAGIGLQNKTLLALPLLVLACAFLLLGPRKLFVTRYFPVALAIAAVIWAPNLWWQMRNGLPQLEMSRAIAGGSSGTSDGPAAFVLLQFGLMGPLMVVLWGAGLWWLARQQRCRAFALTYVLLFVAYLTAGGKAYYLGGMYPVLLAAGATALVPALTRTRARLAATAAVVALNAAVSAVLFLPVLPVAALRDSPILALNYDAGETVGWPRFADRIAEARARSAPDAEILTANYGEAAAIERFGAPYDLPVPRSGHNAYWWWGPPADARPILTVGLTRAEVARFCADSAPESAGRIDNGLGIDNDEQGAAMYVCRTVRAPWAQLWPAQRQLG